MSAMDDLGDMMETIWEYERTGIHALKAKVGVTPTLGKLMDIATLVLGVGIIAFHSGWLLLLGVLLILASILGTLTRRYL